MRDEPCWSIAELRARYDLEPALQDVFVEGSFDRDVLSRVFNDGPNQRTFYEIGAVDVPDDTLTAHGLTSGAKQKVIALARELSGLPSAAKVRCLVDRDLDHWFGTLESSEHLHWTLFCCLGCHFLTAQVVTEIMVTTCRARISSIDSFFTSLLEALKRLYALRLADRQLALALKWVALRKYLRREGDTLKFNDDDYVIAVLNRNARSAQGDEFRCVYQQWLGNLNSDYRLAARGHDYTDLLAWSVAQFGGRKEFASTEVIERVFVLLARTVETIQGELQ